MQATSQSSMAIADLYVFSTIDGNLHAKLKMYVTPVFGCIIMNHGQAEHMWISKTPEDYSISIVAGDTF